MGSKDIHSFSRQSPERDFLVTLKGKCKEKGINWPSHNPDNKETDWRVTPASRMFPPSDTASLMPAYRVMWRCLKKADSWALPTIYIIHISGCVGNPPFSSTPGNLPASRGLGTDLQRRVEKLVNMQHSGDSSGVAGDRLIKQGFPYWFWLVSYHLGQ